MQKQSKITSSIVLMTSMTVFFSIGYGICRADSLDNIMMSGQLRKVKKEMMENAKKYCAENNFNKDKCKKACSYLKKVDADRPKECDNLKILPKIIPPVVPKQVISKPDPLKKQWKLQRQQVLNNLSPEKKRLEQEFKERFTEERCVQIQGRINEKILSFDTVDEKYMSVYTNLVNRNNKFIDRFKVSGLNTDTIKSHLAELQIKIDKFKDDFANYKAKLNGLKSITCGHSEGEFRGALLEAKELLKTAHSDAVDIRTYARTVIFEDLKTLKAQMPKDQNEDGENRMDDPANGINN